MSQAQQQLIIKVSNFMSKCISESFGSARVSWNIEELETLENSDGEYATFSVTLETIERFKQVVQLNQSAIDKIGGLVKQNIGEHNNEIAFQSDLSIKDRIVLIAKQNEDNESQYEISLQEGLQDSSGGSIKVYPMAASIGEYPYREPLEKFDIIAEIVQSSYANKINENFQIPRAKADLGNVVFVNPKDNEILETVSNQFKSSSKDASALQVAANSLVSKPVTKKREEGNDEALQMSEVTDRLVELAQNVFDSCNKEVFLQYIMRIRSAELKRALGVSSNTSLHQLDEYCKMIENRVVSYSELKFLSEEELKEAHIKYMREIASYAEKIGDITSNLVRSYASFINQ